MAELETKPHILYRFYDRTNVLLYVGITVNLGERMKQHAADKDWWPRVDRSATRIEYLDSRRAALDAEREAIKVEKPLHNDQHNEWVEDESTGDEAQELALEILSSLDEVDRTRLLKEAETDWEGDPVPDRERDLEAARGVASHYWCKIFDLTQDIDYYLDLLPDGRGEYHRERARQDYFTMTAAEGYPNYHPMQIAGLALKSLLVEEARLVLDQFPLDEAREWVASARTIGNKAGDDRIIFGARYARGFKDLGRTFVYLCEGPGNFGARCTKKADAITYFEVCSNCSVVDGCQGHRYWCEAHAGAAAQGDTRMLACNPAALLPILRSTTLDESKSEVPF